MAVDEERAFGAWAPTLAWLSAIGALTGALSPPCTGAADGVTHAVGLMADDGKNIPWRNHSACGCDDVRQQRLPPHFVKHLGMF